MTNPFDELGSIQDKARKEARSYSFFINKGFVTDLSEIINLYKWFDKDGSIRDEKGKMRIKLLLKIPDVNLLSTIAMKKLRFEPNQLQEYINIRLSTK